MLKIRRDQDAAMLAEVRLNFEDRVHAYVTEHWSEWAQSAGEEPTREFIRSTIDRAESHGVTIEADVVKYLEVAILLGGGFDESGAYPWAQRILRSRETDATIKVTQLRHWALKELEPTQTEGDGE